LDVLARFLFDSGHLEGGGREGADEFFGGESNKKGGRGGAGIYVFVELDDFADSGERKGRGTIVVLLLLGKDSIGIVRHCWGAVPNIHRRTLSNYFSIELKVSYHCLFNEEL